MRKGRHASKCGPTWCGSTRPPWPSRLPRGGLRFPPVISFTDGGDFYWLGDGFHRVLAARQAGLTEIAAEVRGGTQRDALLFGICANGAHGLPRSNADKRHAVALVLADPEWSQWNDREIARRLQVSNVLVSKMRRSASVNGLQIEGRKVRRGDSVYEMNVGAKEATDDTAKTEPATLVTPTDLLGIPLPEGRGAAFAAAADFQEARDLFDRLSTLLERIAQGPAGEVYRLELVRTNNHGKAGYACPAVRAARNKLVAAEPYCGYCPSCTAQRPSRGHSSCKVCGGRGWTPRAAFESCRECDRQQILKLKTAKPK
jgi:ParB-like chromosome segregation protein Spo0J